MMKRTWTADELLEHFTLSPAEVATVGNKTGATRLGFAILLKTVQYVGRFPRARQEVATDVVTFLAAQVGVDAALFANYVWEGRTIESHRAQIWDLTKIRECRHADEADLSEWLCTQILDHEQHPERLQELVREHCKTRSHETPDDIAAVIAASMTTYETHIYTVILARLTPEMQQRLDALLVPVPNDEEEELPLSLVRRDPGLVGVTSALSEMGSRHFLGQKSR